MPINNNPAFQPQPTSATAPFAASQQPLQSYQPAGSAFPGTTPPGSAAGIAQSIDAVTAPAEAPKTTGELKIPQPRDLQSQSPNEQEDTIYIDREGNLQTAPDASKT
jgi:hypothetical protein